MGDAIWYSCLGFTGLGQIAMTRSAVGIVVDTLVPPSIAATIAEARETGRFPA
jgi:hypothetical protein